MSCRNPKIHLALALSAALACLTLPASGKDADSLRPMELFISSEVEAKSRVLILKDALLADSLLKGWTRLDREAFARLMEDSALAKEIRTPAEFRRYWTRLEEEQGFRELRAQYPSRDIDKARIPKLPLFDSSVVVYPGCIVLRKK